jgi:hypothetical protein
VAPDGFTRPDKLYTDSEIPLIRQQLRVGNALARRAAKQRGYNLHPKLAANRRAKASRATFFAAS